jgi:hypothetical protein
MKTMIELNLQTKSPEQEAIETVLAGKRKRDTGGQNQ